MKLKTRLSVVCNVLLLLSFTACSNDASNKTENREPNIKPVTLKSVQPVSLSEATTAIRAYGDWWRSLNIPASDTPNITRAFLIPGSDLIGVLDPKPGTTGIIDECKYAQARAYIGLDANNVIHLYLTPVDGDGKDVILTNPANNEQQVFDLTTPCPRTCDETSPLYTAFN